MANKKQLTIKDVNAKVDKLADSVRVTIGPKGRNVVLDKSYGAPLITNDGVTIAKEIELEDAFENMGAQLVKEVATKTNDVAGDGTTTATVLAQAMIAEGMKNLAAGANPIVLRKGMKKATDTAVEAIVKMSKAVNGKDQIARVAAISAGDDEAYFESITQEALTRSRKGNDYDAEYLLTLPPAVLKRVLSKIIEAETGESAQAVHINSVADILAHGKTQVLSGMQVKSENGILSFGEEHKTAAWSMDFALNEKIATPCKTVEFQIIHKNEEVRKQFVHKNVLDFDRIIGKPGLRSRQSGDEIRIAGRNCTKKIKKLLTEAKIKDKNSVIILCDEKGPVWVEGFGCAHRCRITDKTENVLKIIY